MIYMQRLKNACVVRVRTHSTGAPSSFAHEIMSKKRKIGKEKESFSSQNFEK